MTRTMLSPHFSLEELCASQLALRLGIDNSPSQVVSKNLALLAVSTLEPIRVGLDKVVMISSGYRAPEVNRRTGGSISSQHVKGQAADFEVLGMDNLEAAHWIAMSPIPFDQLILEFYVPSQPASGWLHISHSAGANRRQILTATRERGTVSYSSGLPQRPA